MVWEPNGAPKGVRNNYGRRGRWVKCPDPFHVVDSERSARACSILASAARGRHVWVSPSFIATASRDDIDRFFRMLFDLRERDKRRGLLA